MKTKLFHYRWDAPTKNPNAVDGYRIFYHEAAVLPPTSSSGSGSSAPSSDQGSAMENTGMDTLAAMNNATSMGGGSNNAMAALEIRRIDVKDTTISINGLKKDVLYELVVKAGNSYGKITWGSRRSPSPGRILICRLVLQVPACSQIRLGSRSASTM